MMESKRLRSGETIIETLFALVIAALSMLFLATAVIASARVNTAVDNEDTSFRAVEEGAGGIDGQVTLSAEGVEPVVVDVVVYETDNGYSYYELNDKS